MILLRIFLLQLRYRGQSLLHFLFEAILIAIDLQIQHLYLRLVIDGCPFLFCAELVDPTLEAFLLLLQFLNHIVFFDIGLHLAILPLMDLHLHVPMKEQLDDILQSFLNAVALHDTLHAADLLLCLLLLEPVLIHQPFISLAQVIDDLLDRTVFLMQI